MPGEDIPCNIERLTLRDNPSEDEEIWRGVIKSHLHRLTGGSKIRAEDMKFWLKGIKYEEKAEVDGKEGYAGAWDAWRLLVKLIRHIWETGEILQQMLWTIIVLIPKGNTGDFRGIGLLEVIWKVIERVLDERLSSIPTHDASQICPCESTPRQQGRIGKPGKTSSTECVLQWCDKTGDLGVL